MSSWYNHNNIIRNSIINNAVDFDDQYLFRLTSTFGWDDAISLCESLILGIETSAAASSRRRQQGQDDNDERADDNDDDSYNYFFNDSLLGQRENRNEKSLQQWLRQAHQQLFYRDQWGNCPIHAASYVKPPLNVIDALFRLGRAIWDHSSYYRTEHEYIPLWATSCKDGSTPFLVACTTGASTSVLHRYLDEVEFYIEKKWVEHPKLARLLIFHPDSQGSTPLMGWMSFHLAYIKLQLEKPHHGNESDSSEMDSHQFIPRNGRQESSQDLSDYWNLACRILIFATSNIRPHSPLLTPVLIHRCAAMAMYCPVSLLEWVVSPRTYNGDTNWLPADISAATTDSLGKLPMHRALEAVDLSSIFDEDIVHHGIGFDDAEPSDTDTRGDSLDLKTPTTMPPSKTHTSAPIEAAENVCPREEAILYNNPKLEQNRVQIIKKLLQWHPHAATTSFPNARPPLIQAIAHGGTWHQMGYHISGCDSNNSAEGLLQVLWGYAPEQSLEIDPVTKLYPFMLAATKNRSGLELDCDVVDTVYNLLRKDPQLVGCALTVSTGD